MKKFQGLTAKLLVLALVLAAVAGFTGAAGAAETVLKVGATPVPHAEILEVVKPILAKQGIKLEVVEFTDYVQPNLALASGDLDANFFQHVPYLEAFSKDHNLQLTYIAKVHVEPMGVYSQKIKKLNELKDKAIVAIPNDPTNGGRALLLLQKARLIELKKGAGLAATVFDIARNPKNLQFKELEAAQLPRALADVDLAVINTNYALEARLVPARDALVMEAGESPYANVLAVRVANKDKKTLKALAKALNGPEVKKFLEEKYKGAVVPAF